MNAIDANSVIKGSIYFFVTLACFAFVFWQSVQCIQKYIESPQGTKLSLKNTREIHQFPAITICPWYNDLYNEDHLEKCGLRYDNLFHCNTTTEEVFQIFIYF